MSDEAGVLEAVGRIGTAGVLDAAGCCESTGACVGIAGPFVCVGRILNATLATCPAGTVTLSSAYPRLGCHARMRYLPGGIPSMLKVPAAEVWA